MPSPKEVTDLATKLNITKAAAAKRLLRRNNLIPGAVIEIDETGTPVNVPAALLPASPPMESGSESIDDPTDLEGEGTSGSI